MRATRIGFPRRSGQSITTGVTLRDHPVADDRLLRPARFLDRGSRSQHRAAPALRADVTVAAPLVRAALAANPDRALSLLAAERLLLTTLGQTINPAAGPAHPGRRARPARRWPPDLQQVLRRRRIERLAIRGIATCAGATRKLLMPTCHARAGQQPRSLSRGLPSVLPSSLRRVRSSAADGSKSSIGLQQASSSRICWPPGPLTISLRRLSASSQPGRRRLNSPSYKTPQTILCSGQAAAGHPACGTRAG
jgi:hypothetical protein